MSQPARIPTPAHGLESKAITTKLPKRPVGVSPDRGLFAFAAALFLAEAVAIAIMYTVSLCDGFSLVIVMNHSASSGSHSGPFRLPSRSRSTSCGWWSDARSPARCPLAVGPARFGPQLGRVGKSGPNRTVARRWSPRGRRRPVRRGRNPSPSVFPASYFTGFSTALTTDSYGEFWLEFPIVLSAVSWFALYVLGTASERLLPSLHRMRQVDSITS